MNTSDYLNANRELWDNWARIHFKSRFYDVEGFKAGRTSLDRLERELLGDVAGKTVLHLQCHFGMDTLSLARLGARVTGVDFSEEAIGLARHLAEELGLTARFICANIYDLPEMLSEPFDLVFTSYGVLPWLPALSTWGQVIGRLTCPGGRFLIVDGHPFAMVFDEGATDLRIVLSYFHSDEPQRYIARGTYADPMSDYTAPEYEWSHSLADIINSLIAGGLAIDELREFPFAAWKMLPFMEQDAEGFWRLPARFPQLPLTFSVGATRVARAES